MFVRPAERNPGRQWSVQRRASQQHDPRCRSSCAVDHPAVGRPRRLPAPAAPPTTRHAPHAATPPAGERTHSQFGGSCGASGRTRGRPPPRTARSWSTRPLCPSPCRPRRTRTRGRSARRRRRPDSRSARQGQTGWRDVECRSRCHRGFDRGGPRKAGGGNGTGRGLQRTRHADPAAVVWHRLLTSAGRTWPTAPAEAGSAGRPRPPASRRDATARTVLGDHATARRSAALHSTPWPPAGDHAADDRVGLPLAAAAVQAPRAASVNSPRPATRSIVGLVSASARATPSGVEEVHGDRGRDQAGCQQESVWNERPSDDRGQREGHGQPRPAAAVLAGPPGATPHRATGEVGVFEPWSGLAVGDPLVVGCAHGCQLPSVVRRVRSSAARRTGPRW